MIAHSLQTCFRGACFYFYMAAIHLNVSPRTLYIVYIITHAEKAGFQIISLDNNQKKSTNSKVEERNSSEFEEDVNVFNINHKNPFINALNNNNNYKHNNNNYKKSKAKKPPIGGSTTPNSCKNNKTYTFVCKSQEEANRWMDAFNDETLLVKSDHDNGFDIKKARKFIRMPSTTRTKGVMKFCKDLRN